jgi:threonine synthase
LRSPETTPFRRRRRNAVSLFYGAFATEEETRAQIKRAFDETGYLLDPHTAVGFAVYERYKEETGDKTPTVITATASPYKFARECCAPLRGKRLLLRRVCRRRLFGKLHGPEDAPRAQSPAQAAGFARDGLRKGRHEGNGAGFFDRKAGGAL